MIPTMPPHNDDVDDDDSSASSTPLFESPSPSVSNDDYLPEDALSPSAAATAANSRRKNNTFDLPALNSQDDSIIDGQSSPTLKLATQPSSQTQQPSTPSPVPTKAVKTNLVNNSNNNKGKKRKVSMSPTDSLARTKQNNRAVATERRTSPRKKVKHVPKQQEEIIEIQEENDDDHNVVRTSSKMENVETSTTTKGNELIRPAKPTEPRGGVDDSLETRGDKKRKVKQSSTCRHNLAAHKKPSDTAAIKNGQEEKESMTTTTEIPTNAAAKKKSVATKKKKSLVASNNHPDENIEKIDTTPSSNSKSSKKRPQKVDTEVGSSSGPPSKKKPKKAASSATNSGTTSNLNTKTVSGASQSNKIDAAVTTVTSSTTAAEAKKKPPKKKKRSYENRLLHHLFTSCKPSTIKDLAKQLDTNETAINHCMLSLTDKGWISKKEFTSKGGRSKELVWANQPAVNKYKGLSDALRMASSQEISAAKEQRTKLEKEDRQLAQSMEQVTKEPSNEELDGLLAETQAKVSELEQKRDSTLARIEKANDNNDNKRQQSKSTQPAQVGRKKKQYHTSAKKNTPRGLKNRINLMRDEWKKRKNKCMDFVDNLADGMEKRVKDVVKLLDIETDESEGVKMPPKYDLN